MTRHPWSVLLAKLSIPVYVTEAVVNVVNGDHLYEKEKRRFMTSRDGGAPGKDSAISSLYFTVGQQEGAWRVSANQS